MTAIVTTTGLREPGADAATVQDVKWAAATGSANVIVAAYTDTVTELTDGLILGFRASAANTTTTPTFNPDSLGAGTITRGGGTALLPGDIPAAGAECLVRYRLSATRWELLNPARGIPGYDWVDGGGSADAITATYVPAVLALTDGLTLRVRATAANATTTPTFSPNGLTARTIVKEGGVALVAGDIRADDHELILTYKLASTRWELLNPSIPTAIPTAIAAANALRDELGKYLTADNTGGQNANTLQPWLPTAGGVTLAAGTYRFKGQLFTTRAAGSTSHTTGIIFSGTAVTSFIAWQAGCKEGDANDLQDQSVFRGAGTTLPTSSQVVKAASTSTTENTIIEVEGVVVVDTAGTFIPNFIYSAAPGGAPTIKAGTFFLLKPLVSNPSGTWA